MRKDDLPVVSADRLIAERLEKLKAQRKSILEDIEKRKSDLNDVILDFEIADEQVLLYESALRKLEKL